MPVDGPLPLRTFFSVVPDAQTCLAIERWATLNWPAVGRPVPVQNYHLTLAFLGETSQRQLDQILEQFDQLEPEPFALVLNQIGYWPESGVLWLGPTQVPAALAALADRCGRVANRVGIKVSRKRFKPHLTLARKVTTPPAAAMIEQRFETLIDGFALCESIRDRGSARYIDLSGWYHRQRQ